MELSKSERKTIEKMQRNEISEYHIYSSLARKEKNQSNREILEHVARDELRHYNIWKNISGKEMKPDMLKIWKYLLLSRIFGITFGLKMMESGEKGAQAKYMEIGKFSSNAKSTRRDEEIHEKKLLKMIDEERLRYVGSIVLGLNDALVELTGTLAGFTLAIANNSIIAIAGLITGIAAALSMAASEYLSAKSSEESQRSDNPLKSSIYTGTAYILTVLFLIFPYFIFNNIYISLASTLLNALIVIFIFNFYVSVAKELPFKKRFVEMALISFGIAAITFAIGFVIKVVLGISI